MWTEKAKTLVHEILYKYRQIMIDNGMEVFPITKISYGRSYNTWGQCTKYKDNTCEIMISEVAFSSVDSLIDTILHELCHAMPNTSGHDAQFYTYAKKVNTLFRTHVSAYASKEETKNANEYKKSLYRYVVECKDCKRKWAYIRKSQIVKALENHHADNFFCPYCHTSNFILKYL